MLIVYNVKESNSKVIKDRTNFDTDQVTKFWGSLSEMKLPSLKFPESDRRDRNHDLSVGFEDGKILGQCLKNKNKV